MATLTKLSYGGTAAVVTGMGVIVGFDAATASKATLVGSLLLIAVADNLADSLAIHAYQESERLAAKQAFRSTVANFVTRFLVAASFLILVLALPSGRLTPAALAWGMALLGTLTYFVARDRGRHRREPGDWHMDSRSASAGDRGREPGPDVRASSAVRLDFDLEVPSFPAVGLGPEEVNRTAAGWFRGTTMSAS